MNKVLLVILSFLSVSCFAVEEPNPCPSRVEGTEHGYKMDVDVYSIKSEFDGELYYVSISLPQKYNSRDLSSINLYKKEQGKVKLASGLALEKERGFSKAYFYAAPSEIETLSISAVYFSYYECQGKLVWDTMRGYDLPINITRRSMSPSAGQP
ncbi:hypothetical protein QT397_24770 [Microbulbifer sp. MKSA007]|nr:hypothetical protein QT397_24770 [Microbulbifer sp. MKSA007]